MKRLLMLLALAGLILPAVVQAQIPRTVLAEMGSATW
jgi:hypothetical protein